MNDVKLYQSIKQVHAKPCTDHQYNTTIAHLPDEVQTRGIIPTIPDSERDGYLVIYNKDKPNQYISWCPKGEFEEGNVEVER